MSLEPLLLKSEGQVPNETSAASRAGKKAELCHSGEQQKSKTLEEPHVKILTATRVSGKMKPGRFLCFFLC
jgi:hypothetical protein